ncbi:MAG: alpha/beta hydrolase [bacterium]|nr:alpha/beta hydrolase [bacterium]MCP4965447.1 alpha/beta hydrolase [bacterium]
MPDSFRSFTARDGIEIAYTEWGEPDVKPLVVFVHATGFCKELCEPVIDDLDSMVPELRGVAIDQRAHGDSGVPDRPFDWWDAGRDVVELCADATGVIGVGHSAGGAALVLAELASPGLFSGLVLVEPIIFPPPYGRFPDNPMANGALRRRDRFTSREAAFSNWVSKLAFAGWEERAMRAYVRGGLSDDGDAVVLKCSPESEAEFFTAATDHRAWDRLAEIDVPVLVIAGERSTTHQEPYLGELVERMPRAVAEVVPGASHFVWMERPHLVAERVAEFISSFGQA